MCKGISSDRYAQNELKVLKKLQKLQNIRTAGQAPAVRRGRKIRGLRELVISKLQNYIKNKKLKVRADFDPRDSNFGGQNLVRASWRLASFFSKNGMLLHVVEEVCCVALRGK